MSARRGRTRRASSGRVSSRSAAERGQSRPRSESPQAAAAPRRSATRTSSPPRLERRRRARSARRPPPAGQKAAKQADRQQCERHRFERRTAPDSERARKRQKGEGGGDTGQPDSFPPQDSRGHHDDSGTGGNTDAFANQQRRYAREM